MNATQLSSILVTILLAGCSVPVGGMCEPVSEPVEVISGDEACRLSDDIQVLDGPCPELELLDCPWAGREVCDRERIEAILALQDLTCEEVVASLDCWATACQ